MHSLFLLILIRLESGLLNYSRIYHKDAEQKPSDASEEVGFFGRFPLSGQATSIYKGVTGVEYI